MSANALLMSYGTPLIICDAADFDGSNDYMNKTSELTGMADGQKGVVSFWYRVDGGDGSTRAIFARLAGYYFYIWHDAGNKINVQARNSAGTIILGINTTTAYLASSTWLHFLISWDLSITTAHLYVNDSSDLTSSTLTNDTINYTGGTSEWWFAVNSGGFPATLINGCFAEMYFAPNQYLDFSIESNRRKFISASGKPMFLGTNGLLPTGTSPLIYFHLDNGEATANFATNRGTGGDFSITGTLSTASTSPSD